MQTETTTKPEFSVVLASSAQFSNVKRTIDYLRRQTIADKIEIILVAPSLTEFGLPEDAQRGFSNIKLVAAGKPLPINEANAIGVAAASADIVAFAEDHAFPEPDWADHLLKRHLEGCDVVGPALRNANPRTAVSWGDFLVSYGPWIAARPGGEATVLPGHNSSYKKSILLGTGEKLAAELEAESVFHEKLSRTGFRLYFEPQAVITHLNFTHLDVLLRVAFQYGRNYAARRAADWPIAKRAIYFLAAPLIPLVRLSRLLRHRIRIEKGPAAALVWLVVFIDLLCDGAGQAVGYIFGTGRSADFLLQYEYDRVRFVSNEELRNVEPH